MLPFDEATGALDNRTQAVVSRSIESLRLTQIVIAHRLSTVISADRIYVLNQGRIAQTGTYSDLMAKVETRSRRSSFTKAGSSPAATTGECRKAARLDTANWKRWRMPAGRWKDAYDQCLIAEEVVYR